MSKSLGNVADPFAAMDQFGVDVVRYYLARVGGRFCDDVGWYLHPNYLLLVLLSDLVVIDWSQKQLDKHSKEIQSLLGNLFLRITSRKILSRLVGAPPRTFEEIHKAEPEWSLNRLLLDTLLDLPEKFKSSMDDLDVSNALALIVDVLRLVLFSYYRFLSSVLTLLSTG
jgi:methionyl-tRNA synthetase